MTTRRDQKRVLIVDHDHPLRDDLVDMLKGRHIGTVIAGRAEEAIEHLRTQAFHLILLGPLSSYNETLHFMQNIKADPQLKKYAGDFDVRLLLLAAFSRTGKAIFEIGLHRTPHIYSGLV